MHVVPVHEDVRPAVPAEPLVGWGLVGVVVGHGGFVGWGEEFEGVGWIFDVEVGHAEFLAEGAVAAGGAQRRFRGGDWELDAVFDGSGGCQ